MRHLLLVRTGRSLHAGRARIEDVETLVGRAAPDMYSPDLSLFVLDAGIRLVEAAAAYLSLSITCSTAMRLVSPRPSNFTRALDDRLGRFANSAASWLSPPITGMNDKALPDGRPHVLFLEDFSTRSSAPARCA